MTISINPTGIALAGPLDPVSSIEIADPDGNESTLKRDNPCAQLNAQR